MRLRDPHLPLPPNALLSEAAGDREKRTTLTVVRRQQKWSETWFTTNDWTWKQQHHISWGKTAM